MFEKEKGKELYIRESFSFEEKLYKSYIEMRNTMNSFEKMKYSNEDPYQSSESFKQGFLAGVKIISSMIIDM